MNNNTELFDKIMNKYKFIELIDPEMQKYMRKAKWRIFKKILKRVGQYSLLFSAVTYIFFALKKMGFSVSIAKCTVIFVVSTGVIGASVTTGVYKVIKNNVLQEKKVEKNDEVQKSNAVEDSIQVQEPQKIIERRIGVQLFQAENVDKKITWNISNNIANELIRLNGDIVINYITQKEKKRVGKMLMGTIEEIGGIYTISAKIVSVNNAKILFFTSESARSTDEIDEACKKISKKISNNIK